MNNDQHLLNVNAIDSIRGKLEYCVDNGITSENCGSELLEILEDLRDQVRENVDNNTRASEVEYAESYAVDEQLPVILGMDRRTVPNTTLEVDNLGNVFNSRGAVLTSFFDKRYGGLMIRDQSAPSRPRIMVARLVLTAFDPNPKPDNPRVMFRDNDQSNCKVENLRWINGSSSSTASQTDSLEKQQESGA